jgi:hypothetical protein
MDKSKMTEAELADYFYEHRGDTTGWKRVERPRSLRGKPTSVFSVRFTGEELNSLQAAAGLRGQYVSGFIRDAALEAARVLTSETLIGSEGNVVKAAFKESLRNRMRGAA